MKFTSRTSAIALGATLLLAICVNSARAEKPATIPAYYDGDIVYVIPGVSDNVVGVDYQGIANDAANPLYLVLPVSDDNGSDDGDGSDDGVDGSESNSDLDDTSGADSQTVDHVLGISAPGAAGYNPFWEVITVTVLNDRDLTKCPFTSEAEILEAYANDEVDLDDTGFILLCQVISE